MAEHEAEAQIGYGMELHVGNGADPEVFTELLGDMTEFDPPELQADAVESTHMKSPGKHRERIAGMLDTGEFVYTGHFVGGETAVPRALVGTKKNLAIIYPLAEGQNDVDREVWVIPTVITGFKPGTPMDDRMTYTLTGTPGGKPVIITKGDL